MTTFIRRVVLVHLKEADALLRALQAQASLVCNSRVHAFVDNMAVVQAWDHEGCKNMDLTSLITQIFDLTTRLNAHLTVLYVRSADNPADIPSRQLSSLDSMLSPAFICGHAWKPCSVRSHGTGF